MLRKIRAAIAAACILASSTALAGVGVIDGDTLDVDGQRVRVFGIDAPEMRQQCYRNGVPFDCGREARLQLWRLVNNRPVTCTQVDRDRYGRAVAKCQTAGVDIGSLMIRCGWAVEYTRYSRGIYAGDQAAAKSAKRGLWADGVVFVNPWDWRQK